MTFALVDANNFYVSCERLFAPQLEGRPVVILSNNDGCAVSRSAEAKALGIGMGKPYFQWQKLAEQQGVVVLSSNYALYGELSARMMRLLGSLSAAQEIYSIDESFLHIPVQGSEALLWGQATRRRVHKELGLPVCVGMGPSKTLAKLCNHWAKKGRMAGGVCDWDSIPADQKAQWLQETPVDAVWGIGRQGSKSLAQQHIHQVMDLLRADPVALRQRYGVVLARIHRELQGVSCLSLEQIPPKHQHIQCSRSFGRATEKLADLEESLSVHAQRCAAKLRQDGQVAQGVQIQIRSSPHRGRYYSGVAFRRLNRPSNDYRELWSAVKVALAEAYRPGVRYVKSGILLSDLQDVNAPETRNLFAPETDAAECRNQKQAALAETLSLLQKRYGKAAPGFGVAGLRTPQVWSMRTGKRSPHYLSDWSDIPVVQAGYSTTTSSAPTSRKAASTIADSFSSKP
ncbi:Y-family DNA polymerase [Acidithiobacillus montserratensis]|uniref:Y-family DNA polymerase n=1 Tax=Acidithiobacillus montserratensis TaxID=2729135 RepID=A0ACD5HEP2_9PROT|nr:Y-family DNA polymerase [Acidithiobacillus montserratensis]MBN2679944.1 Y-family DNA polymerase [Acidithiobacillaceae bacterium]MBU2747991.1 Y-family DNA polymerase [Acidithiobacillus montserratensis]